MSDYICKSGGVLIGCTHYFRILLGIPSYPVEFLGVRDIIIVLTSASETRIVSICTIL